MKKKQLAVLILAAALVVGMAIPGAGAEAPLPELEAEALVSGLNNPWAVAQLPDGSLLFTQRRGSLGLWREGEVIHIADIPQVAARGEGGLTGLAADTDFTENRLIYLAYNTAAGSPEVRVTRYRLSENLELADALDIVTGIPANPSGRHSGTQLQMGPDGILFIGTGDAANADNPQNPRSLAGKVLRVTREGEPAPGNLKAPFDPRIFSFGHRNVQGLALFDEPVDGLYGFSAEHGPGRDDEMNPLLPGNFGWAPRPPYDEGVPMTDLERFPDAVPAAWASGNPTIAVSGLALIQGEAWGGYQGALVMGVLKGRQLRAVWLKDGQTASQETLFEGEFGRIRAALSGVDGSLYITTDNGSDDRIIRISPAN
ncbi:MAG: PQQ-dependent sugar dehydrogenase [Eubacteriales bacterium]|nr:PQQ-dependent sugar dehydrogenase [Eubacteriales bacterium]